jgi:hypothetical protein
MAKVKCCNCGLLAARNQHTGEFVEVHHHARETGQTYNLGPTTHETPVCFVDAHDLQQEFQKHPAQNDNSKRMLGVVTHERECTEFCQWRQGFTPKEHVMLKQTEMLRKEIEDRRIADEQRAEQRRLDDEKRAEERRNADRDQAEKRLVNDREWQTQQKKDDREWQEKSQEKQEADKRRFQKQMIWYSSILGLILAAIVGLVSFFGGKWYSRFESNQTPPVVTPIPKAE